MTERGQSEVLGFVVVFGIIVASVSLLTVAGLGELGDVRDAQRVDNVHESLKVLADNVDELVVNGAPVRETEIRLAGGDLAFGEPVTITVSGHAASDRNRNFSYGITSRPLVYRAGTGQRVVYSSGGVFWQHRGSASMTNGRPILLSSDRSTVSVVQTRRGSGSVGVGGSGTALIRARRVVTDLYQVNGTAYDVTIRIDSPRAAAWKRQLSARSDVTCRTPEPESMACSFDSEAIAVGVVRIDLEVH
jgi:hypothetical protein